MGFNEVAGERNLQESRGPDLAGDESTAQDANEETNGDQGSNTVCRSREGSGNRTKEKSANESPSSTESVTTGSGDDSNEEGGSESGDVGVGDINGTHVEILSDSDSQEWWEGIPRPEGDEETKPRKEEYTAVHVDDIKNGNRPRLVVDWVDLWRLP